MTTSISIKDDSLLVDVEGADKLWALKSQLQIPITHVANAVSAETEARKWLHGMRLGGTHVPGVISAGRFYSQGRWVFWDVHDAARAIGIDLRDEHYARLVVEVADPLEEIEQIRKAVQATLATGPPRLGERGLMTGGC